MNSEQAIAGVIETLEVCAETKGDIVPEVFERFFALDQDAHALMGHSDRQMQGRMFEAVLDLLMTDEYFGPSGYLEWELENHIDAYAATPAMYAAFFTAVLEVVRGGVADWDPKMQGAWEQRIDLIMQQVEAHPTP